MSFWDKLKAFDARVDERINLRKRFPGYFTNWVFRAAMVAIVLTVLIAGESVGWKASGSYVHCDSALPCVNPIYRSDCRLGEVCALKTLAPGTVIGERPGFLLRHGELVIFGLVACALLVNHVLYEVKRRW